MSANRVRIAAAAFSLAAVTASASPLQINEAGFDNPATVYSESHALARTSGSAFPWSVNEAGFDNPAIIYSEPRVFARTGGSPFPWTVNEAGPYVAELAPSTDAAAMRTARK